MIAHGLGRQKFGKAILAVILVAAVIAVSALAGTAQHKSPSAAESAAEGGVAKAKSLVASYGQPVKWTLKAPALNPASVKALKGKTVFFVTLNASIPFSKVADAAYKQALAAVGIKMVLFDGKSQPSEFARGIEEAVAQKADAIFLESINPQLVATPIKDANKAHIPVITSENGTAGLAPTKSSGVAADVSICFACVGTRLGALAVAQTNGHLNAIAFIDKEIVPGTADIDNAMLSEIKSLCPSSCKVKLEDVPSASWSTKLGTLTQTAVQDQSINYLIPLYDDMFTFIRPAVHAGGAQSRVKAASFNASPGIIDFVKSGDVLTGEVGLPLPWVGWSWADNTLRVMSGAPPLLNEQFPYRIFDPANIGGVNLKANQETWYGTADYQAHYKKLWGLG